MPTPRARLVGRPPEGAARVLARGGAEGVEVDAALRLGLLRPVPRQDARVVRVGDAVDRSQDAGREVHEEQRRFRQEIPLGRRLRVDPRHPVDEARDLPPVLPLAGRLHEEVVGRPARVPALEEERAPPDGEGRQRLEEAERVGDGVRDVALDLGQEVRRLLEEGRAPGGHRSVERELLRHRVQPAGRQAVEARQEDGQRPLIPQEARARVVAAPVHEHGHRPAPLDLPLPAGGVERDERLHGVRVRKAQRLLHERRVPPRLEGVVPQRVERRRAVAGAPDAAQAIRARARDLPRNPSIGF